MQYIEDGKQIIASLKEEVELLEKKQKSKDIKKAFLR
jgi:hypothetical protein